MEINIPDVLAEVKAVFERYERAINANDVDADCAHTLRLARSSTLLMFGVSTL